MKVFINHENLKYDMENLIAIFVKKSQLSFVKDHETFLKALDEGQSCLKIMENQGGVTCAYFEKTLLRGQCRLDFSNDSRAEKVSAEDKRMLKKAVYQLLEGFYTPMSKWGILVGIRPVKIVHEFLDQGLDFGEIESILSDDYLIDESKIKLVIEIAKRERPHLYPIDPKAFSIYICIPFCPTRCLYCSFPSNDLEKKGKLMTPYVDKLIEEIQYTKNLIDLHHGYVDCIYIGGGTPTALDETELAKLTNAITGTFDMSLVKEFTVEAGRPDSISDEKLRILKTAGVDRICVNPQSMNDKTLVQIGRKHSSEAIITMFEKARFMGFKNINMDLIMGLPGEKLEDAKRTMEAVIKMSPENVTIHTLAVKRASRLNETLEEIELAHDATVESMLDWADDSLRKHGVSPYYMYRQKKMIGHLENVGYAKEGFASLYNMRIMEERHTIIALGAGAVSKICHAHENRFERVANFKGVEDYIDRFEEVLKRKDEAFQRL